MKRIAGIICVCLLAATLGHPQNVVRLSEMRTSRGVDPKLQSPIDVTETFAPDPGPIFVTGKLLDAPAGTKVRIVVFYVENGDQQIASHDFPDISGTGYFSFKLNSPASGWFLGRFKAVFYLNGKEQGSIGFAVVKSTGSGSQPPAQTQTQPQSQASYRTFSSRDFGFTVQYPAGWVEGERTSKSVACMFLSNPDNNPIASLNVQIVPINNATADQSKEAVDLVGQQLIDQITKSFKGRVTGDQWVTAGSKSGRELDSEYKYKGKGVRQRQFLTFNDGKVFVVIYTVEPKIYDAYKAHYLQATTSLAFIEK